MQRNITPSRASDRPAEFDAKIVEHIDYIKRFACKFVKSSELEEFTQDVIAHSLERWEQYCPERGGFGTWLAWQVRGVLKKKKDRSATYRKHFSDADPEAALAVRSIPAPQENIAAASQAVRRLSRNRGGRMLLRLATGEYLHEIGARRGVTAERVRQLTEDARERLLKVAA